MAKIKRIEVKSLVKLLAVIYSVIGFLAGIVFCIVSFFDPALLEPQAGDAAGAVGLAAIVVFPLLYGLIGIVSGLLLAWTYNWAVRFVGGLEISLE